ncbi:hypothetical protein GFS31_36780 [Leptolyngbya sp. BL0902]|uniref:hypothetical protein n=1 Tax=Leptolyngbya sp. BL0902 TaxID=1115757 RepID=UPI0018E82237|nr:hypothetical protein [Leptolyngbya sp. BL0902]QQE66973.1 hypothetical protein GFS31_36780 [Leptolyngbya sp. BL0902]
MLFALFPTPKPEDNNLFDVVVPGEGAYFIEQVDQIYWLSYRGARWRGIPSAQRIFTPMEEVIIHGRKGTKLIFS